MPPLHPAAALLLIAGSAHAVSLGALRPASPFPQDTVMVHWDPAIDQTFAPTWVRELVAKDAQEIFDRNGVAVKFTLMPPESLRNEALYDKNGYVRTGDAQRSMWKSRSVQAHFKPGGDGFQLGGTGVDDAIAQLWVWKIKGISRGGRDPSTASTKSEAMLDLRVFRRMLAYCLAHEALHAYLNMSDAVQDKSVGRHSNGARNLNYDGDTPEPGNEGSAAVKAIERDYRRLESGGWKDDAALRRIREWESLLPEHSSALKRLGVKM